MFESERKMRPTSTKLDWFIPNFNIEGPQTLACGEWGRHNTKSTVLTRTTDKLPLRQWHVPKKPHAVASKRSSIQ